MLSKMDEGRREDTVPGDETPSELQYRSRTPEPTARNSLDASFDQKNEINGQELMINRACDYLRYRVERTIVEEKAWWAKYGQCYPP